MLECESVNTVDRKKIQKSIKILAEIINVTLISSPQNCSNDKVDCQKNWMVSVIVIEYVKHAT